MILDNSYFKAEIFIPNLVGSSPVNQARSTELEYFAEMYEKDYLELMFGETMAAAIIAAPESYSALMVYLLTQTKGSPLANYVYYHFRANELTLTTGAGESTLNTENATNKSATYKLVKAWNNMVDMSQKAFDYVAENSGDYADYDSEVSFPFEKINTFGI